MNFAIPILFVFVLAFIVWQWRFFSSDNIPKFWFIALFVVKAIIAICICYAFRQTAFSGDTFVFFDSGERLYNISKTEPFLFLRILTGAYSETDLAIKEKLMQIPQWFTADDFANDNRFVFRLNALLRFISFGSFETHAVIFSFLSMIGLTALYKLFESFVTEGFKLLFAAVFLMPSVLFWLSGIFKESLIIFLLGSFMYLLKRIIDERSNAMVMAAALILILLFRIKFYFILAFMPAAVAFYFYKSNVFRYRWMSYASVYGFGLLIFIAVHFVFPDYSPVRILEFKQQNFVNYAEMVQAKSIIPVPVTDGSILSFFKAIPMSLHNIFLKPYPTELQSALWWPVFIENVFLLIFITFILIRRKIIQANLPFALSLILMSSSLFFIIGFTTPVLGSLIRYKAAVLPFFVPAFLILFTPNEKTLQS